MQWEKKCAGRRGVHLVEKNMCAVKIISREKEKELGKKRRRDKIEGYYRHSTFFNNQEKLVSWACSGRLKVGQEKLHFSQRPCSDNKARARN